MATIIAIKISITTLMEMATTMAMVTETVITTLPVVVVDKPDRVVIPQIPLYLHTAEHMARQEMTCTLVVYASTLKLVQK